MPGTQTTTSDSRPQGDGAGGVLRRAASEVIVLGGREKALSVPEMLALGSWHGERREEQRLAEAQALRAATHSVP